MSNFHRRLSFGGISPSKFAQKHSVGGISPKKFVQKHSVGGISPKKFVQKHSVGGVSPKKRLRQPSAGAYGPERRRRKGKRSFGGRGKTVNEKRRPDIRIRGTRPTIQRFNNSTTQHQSTNSFLEPLFLFRSGGSAAVFQLLLIETIDEAERDVPLGVIFVLIEAEAIDACPFVVIERVEKR